MICMYIYYDWVIVYVYLLLQYKDYTLEIVQKLLEPPNGFDACDNNKCRFLALYSTTYSMPISSRFAVLCPYCCLQ